MYYTTKIIFGKEVLLPNLAVTMQIYKAKKQVVNLDESSFYQMNWQALTHNTRSATFYRISQLCLRSGDENLQAFFIFNVKHPKEYKAVIQRLEKAVRLKGDEVSPFKMSLECYTFLVDLMDSFNILQTAIENKTRLMESQWQAFEKQNEVVFRWQFNVPNDVMVTS